MASFAFTGTLKSNEIFGSIYNMLISQSVLADNFTGGYSELTGRIKTDGTLYGDTKLYYATDVLKSYKWGNYAEAANLLQTNKPADPKCQAITLDQFRQINITVDNYLSKRAWSTEGAFGQFQSVVLGMIRETKKLYEETLINSYVGTVESTSNKHIVNVPVSTATTGLTGLDKEKMEAMTIAQSLADLFTDMKDYSRDYNDYTFMRSYSPDSLYVVWNAKYVNKIRQIDLPTIFHKDGLVDKFEDVSLPSRFFGSVITDTTFANYIDASGAANKPIKKTSNTAGTYVPGANHANGTLRLLVEKTIGGAEYFPGDELPVNTTVSTTTDGSGTVLAGEFYIEDSDIICKVIHNNAIKMMSAFEVGTSFYNPRSLTENHYLTWGYSEPAYLKNYPVIMVYKD